MINILFCIITIDSKTSSEVSGLIVNSTLYDTTSEGFTRLIDTSKANNFDERGDG